MAQLVRAAIERARVHQGERPRDLVERDPQIDEVKPRPAIVAIGGVVVKQPRGGAAEDLAQRGAVDVLIGVDRHGGVVTVHAGAAAVTVRPPPVGAGPAHEEALAREVQDAQTAARRQRQGPPQEVAADLGGVGVGDPTGGAYPLEDPQEPEAPREVGMREAMHAKIQRFSRAIEQATFSLIIRPRIARLVAAEGPRPQAALGGEGHVLRPGERELGGERGGARAHASTMTARTARTVIAARTSDETKNRAKRTSILLIVA